MAYKILQRHSRRYRHDPRFKLTERAVEIGKSVKSIYWERRKCMKSGSTVQKSQAK